MLDKDTYTLDLPQREGTQGYVGTFFTLYLKLASILQSPEFTKEPMRLYYMSEFCISMIPDPKKRETIRSAAKEYRESAEADYKKKKSILELSDSQQNHLLIQSSIHSLGLVSDYIDEHIGLSKEHKVFFRKSELVRSNTELES